MIDNAVVGRWLFIGGVAISAGMGRLLGDGAGFIAFGSFCIIVAVVAALSKSRIKP